MSTFLQLCQDLARESGTIAGVRPTTVVGQTGRELAVVEWIRQGWRDIQNLHSDWRWMQAEWSAALSIGSPRYTPTALAITRFGQWVVDTEKRRHRVTIYDPAIGVSDESPLNRRTWEDYRKTYLRGTPVQDRPIEYAISPNDEICFGPTPNLAYVLQGEYRKSPQELTADSDLPEMPVRFHDLITWRGLILLAEVDEGEGGIQIAISNRRYLELKSKLERDQLDRERTRMFTGNGPLA